jgi:restriction endonuclease S subunit
MECFTVYADEIERRLDPNPYHPIRMKTIKKIKSVKIPLFSLKDIADFKKKIVTSNQIDLIYIGLENIESNTGLFIPSEEEKESFGSALKFENGDILFPKLRPYLNKVHLAKFDGVCSTEFHVLKANKCNNVYLFIFLNSNLVVNQTSYLMTGNTLPRLQTEEVENLLIPIPPNEIQEEVIKKIEEAYNQKNQKDAESQTYLNSISNYVLDELGLTLPRIEDKMCFTVGSNEIEGRLDAFYYKNEFVEINKSLQKTNLSNFKFGDLIDDLTGGATPKIEGNFYTDETGIPFLRVQNITEKGIKLEDIKFIKKDVHEGLLKRSKLKKDDLVFTITGRIGSVAVVPENFEGNINQHSARIHLKDATENGIKINPKYVAIFFNTNVGRKLSFRNTSGGTRPALDYEALKTLPIILPPLEIQERIADEVKCRIDKAKKLKDEAETILNQVKSRVERIILGEE